MRVENQHSQHTETAVHDSEWKKFHKITPFSKLGSFWLIVAATVYAGGSNYLQTVNDENVDLESFAGFFTSHLFFLIGILLLVSLAVIVCTYIIWRSMGYAIVESGIHFRKGIFMKTHAHMRWDRVQTVEVEQTLFGRIFGFGEVKVKSSEGTVELGLLRLKECARLRKEILHIENGIRAGYSFVQAKAIMADNDADEGLFASQSAGSGVLNSQVLENETQSQAQAGMRFLEADEVPFTDADQYESDVKIFTLPATRLIGGTLLSLSTIFAVFFSVLFVIVPIFWGSGYIAVFIGLVTLVWGMLKSLFDEYGTKVYLSANGLRVRSGLTKLKTYTYPPQRIHAVMIKQPILWRRFDWWQIKVTVAADVNDPAEATGNFVFAASKHELLTLLWAILPRLGSEDDARLLTEALEGNGTGEFFLGASKRARIFDPISLRGRGFFASKEVLIIRNGRWSRSVTFVLQDHTQSMRIVRGPLAACRDIANFQVHTVGIACVREVKNFDFTQVQRLSHRELELTALARKERVSETLKEWKDRLGVK